MDIQETLSWYETRKSEIEAERTSNSGKLARHEWWRLEYYNNPYLLFCDDEELSQRFVDIFGNISGLNEKGQITPEVDNARGDKSFTRIFTQILEACNSRGGLQESLLHTARAEVLKYFEHGTPLGVTMFDGLPVRKKNTIVKFSKREFLEPMLKFGRIRLAPASFYSKGSLLKSMKDLETEKVFRIPAIKEALDGKKHIEYHGHKMPITGGAITLNLTVPDYYLFSSCLELDRRMPTDFEADAALVIYDKDQFVRMVKKSIKKTIGQAEIFSGPVDYFDPFRWDRKPPVPEMMKHFAYAYQKEHRIAARPVGGISSAEPIFIEIGSIENFATLVP